MTLMWCLALTLSTEPPASATQNTGSASSVAELRKSVAAADGGTAANDPSRDGPNAENLPPAETAVARAPADAIAVGQPSSDPPRRWRGLEPSLLSVGVGAAVVALATFMGFGAGSCQGFCIFRDGLLQISLGAGLAGGVLLISGVLMVAIVTRHNADVPAAGDP